MTDCIPCEIAKLKRNNAILRSEKHALGMAEKCELHASLFSARIENRLRTGQQLAEDLDDTAKTWERLHPGKALDRTLRFPYGTPATLRAMARLSPQMDYTLDMPAVPGRDRELALLREAEMNGKIRRVG